VADAVLGSRAVVGIRDVPRQGLVVRVVLGTSAVLLEPAEAAELGQALLDLATETVHESRSRRRPPEVTT
jgi:hypothetical protein